MAYIGAPYTFVSLPNQVIERKEKIPAHNGMPLSRRRGEVVGNDTVGAEKKDLYSGEITYTIEAKTDLFTGGEKGSEQYRDNQGRPAIPGSSFRSLIRGNVQILGLGSIEDDVDGEYLMTYRKVGAPNRGVHTVKNDYDEALGVGIYRASKEEGGGTVSLRKHVEAGILYFDGKDYFILPCEGEALGKVTGKQNYYILRESTIIRDLQKNNRNGYKGSNFGYLVSGGKNILMHRHDGQYPFYGKKGDVQKGSINTLFRPGVEEISFKVGLNGKVTAVDAPGKLKGSDCYEGYLVSSGFMNKKKTHYIVRKARTLSTDGRNVIELKGDSDEIVGYKHDYEARKNLFGTTQKMPGYAKEEILKANREFYALPDKKGSCKPVFYIKESQSRFRYFGFTPNLRLFYERKIADGIPNSHKNKIDYAKAMMGYSYNKKDGNGNQSRKSRIAFEDAAYTGNMGKEIFAQPQNPVLGSPKPTSFYDYLCQNGWDETSYNSAEIQIRGYKQYWLQNQAKIPPADPNKRENTKVESSFRPVKAGCTFTGKVHFHNLEADELGLLLWALRLEKDSEQNIGKAKAYGFGRIKVQIDELKLFDYEKMYGGLSLDFSPYVKREQSLEDQVAEWIERYKAAANEYLKRDIMKEVSIQQFFLTKDSKHMPDEKDVRYMDVKIDYREREKLPINQRALPEPEDVLGVKIERPAGQKSAKKPAAAGKAGNKGGNQNYSGKSGGSNYPSRPTGTAGRNTSQTAASTANGTEKAESKQLTEGMVVEGIINNALRKGNVINGVFVTLIGCDGANGLLHKNSMKNLPSSYKMRDKIKVKIIKLEQKNGKLNIGLTDNGL